MKPKKKLPLLGIVLLGITAALAVVILVGIIGMFAACGSTNSSEAPHEEVIYCAVD